MPSYNVNMSEDAHSRGTKKTTKKYTLHFSHDIRLYILYRQVENCPCCISQERRALSKGPNPRTISSEFDLEKLFNNTLESFKNQSILINSS
jgi:hypothetical protein